MHDRTFPNGGTRDRDGIRRGLPRLLGNGPQMSIDRLGRSFIENEKLSVVVDTWENRMCCCVRRIVRPHDDGRGLLWTSDVSLPERDGYGQDAVKRRGRHTLCVRLADGGEHCRVWRVAARDIHLLPHEGARGRCRRKRRRRCAGDDLYGGGRCPETATWPCNPHCVVQGDPRLPSAQGIADHRFDSVSTNRRRFAEGLT